MSSFSSAVTSLHLSLFSPLPWGNKLLLVNKMTEFQYFIFTTLDRTLPMIWCHYPVFSNGVCPMINQLFLTSMTILDYNGKPSCSWTIHTVQPPTASLDLLFYLSIVFVLPCYQGRQLNKSEGLRVWILRYKCASHWSAFSTLLVSFFDLRKLINECVKLWVEIRYNECCGDLRTSIE